MTTEWIRISDARSGYATWISIPYIVARWESQTVPVPVLRRSNYLLRNGPTEGRTYRWRRSAGGRRKKSNRRPKHSASRTQAEDEYHRGGDEGGGTLSGGSNTYAVFHDEYAISTMMKVSAVE